jgi:hypothetical protein
VHVRPAERARMARQVVGSVRLASAWRAASRMETNSGSYESGRAGRRKFMKFAAVRGSEGSNAIVGTGKYNAITMWMT